MKLLTKVSQITNLSDARYCAGMGVDFLGFCIEPDSGNYVDPKTYQEITSWISGPEYVLEANDINNLVYKEKYTQHAYIEISAQKDWGEISKGSKVIINIHIQEVSDMITLKEILSNPLPKYFLIECHNEELYDPLDRALGNYLDKIIRAYNVHPYTLDSIIKQKFAGIALKGSKEIKPGYKDFDQLADILEKLDEYF